MADPADDTLKTTSLEASAVLCSICHDAIADDVDRSTAKLQCGHEFHLDCIGSAFNTKGAMQCPNCHKVERGRWLYASGSTRSVAEISMDDWTLHENQYGLGFPETRFNLQWCPFSGLARVHSAFEFIPLEATYLKIGVRLHTSDPPRPRNARALYTGPSIYHNLHRHHNMFAEHGAVPSMAHSYIAYFGPVPSASSSANETVEDPNFGYQWNGISNPHVFPVTDMHYHNGVHQNSHILSPNNARANSSDQAPVAPVTLRSTRGDFSAVARSGSFMHPSLYGHGSRPHERLQPPHTIHNPHQPTNPLSMPSAIIPGMTRFHGRRSLPQPPVPVNSVSNRNGGFFIFPTQGSSVSSSLEAENLLPVISSHRNSGWISFNSGAAGSDSNRTGNFWHGHWS